GRRSRRVSPRTPAASRPHARHGRAVGLERVELFVIRLPLKNAYETSGARETHMTRVLCRVESEGAVGWGQGVAGELPWYPGGTRDRIICGVAIGIQPSSEALIETIRRELEGGYQRVKLKIKPGLEVEIAEATRKAFPDLAFMVDANSAYTLRDVGLFKRIDPTKPTMIELPLAHDDLVDHATLQRQITTPVCLDESIHTSEDARKAIEIGATRVINIKAGRVGGLASAKRVHDVCAAHDIPVWCGG